MNAAGEIVDSSGRKASMKGFTVDGKQAINEGFQTKPVTATEIVLGKNGKPLMYNGRKVYKRADGTLVDEFGNVIKGEDGKPLAMNAAGEIVDSSGRKASMKGFTEDGKPLLSGDLKTKYVSELNELGKSGIHVTEDGLLVDKDGKAITIDNKKVIRGADGQLFDEYGRPILDENGQPVYMDEEGNIVNAQGEPVKNILLQDGTGKIIGSGDNENIRQIGDSDLFANKDGFLLGVDGKPILFDGKAVTVGKNGRLYTVDGKPVVDANGNAVYVGANGELRTKNGDLSKGVLLTNSDGVLLDSKGELVTAGGKLTKLEGTDFYRTQDGMLVTKDGKVVSLSGERLFISDDGLLQNAYLRPIRFRGKSLSIGKNGDLYDEQGRKVVDENNSPITLTENGLSSELGVLLEQNNTPKRNLSLPPAEEVVDLISSIGENESEIEEADQVDSAAKDEDNKTKSIVDRSVNGTSKIDISELSISDIKSLNKRYAAIKSAMESKLSKQTPKFEEPLESSLSKGTGQTYVESLNSSANSNLNSDVVADGNRKNGVSENFVKQKAGTLLYAVNTTKVNTDVNSKVVFNIFGVDREHILYGATAHGKVSLKYDFIVVEFNRICLRSSVECTAIDGLAVDPGTREPSVNGEIDKHYWYRFGGLTIASLIQGAAEAVGSSQERTEETDLTGKKVTYSGLDGTKLAISSTQVLGEQFANIFLENASRPITGYVEEGEEVGIFLFEDINFKNTK